MCGWVNVRICECENAHISKMVPYICTFTHSHIYTFPKYRAAAIDIQPTSHTSYPFDHSWHRGRY